MKLIILIIASHNEHYDKMMAIWEKYMNTHPNITTYFIMNDENINDTIQINSHTMYVKHYECFIPGILYKTIKSVDYCLANCNFDYIYRTNLSSFIVLDKLYNFVNRHNHINYGGVIGRHITQPFASGCGFLLSKDACVYLSNHQYELNYNVLDDVAIGEVMTKQYDITPVLRIDNSNQYDFYDFKNNEIFHYRCNNGLNNPENTVSFMEKLYAVFYN